MSQPADYAVPEGTQIVACHCRAGDICINTGRMAEHKRCRIRRERVSALSAWAHSFQTGFWIGALVVLVLVAAVLIVRGG